MTTYSKASAIDHTNNRSVIIRSIYVTNHTWAQAQQTTQQILLQCRFFCGVGITIQDSLPVGDSRRIKSFEFARLSADLTASSF